MNKYTLITNFVEILAAIAGIFYIRKNRIEIPVRFFVYFLCLTVLVELLGLFPSLIYYEERFSFLKGTFLQKKNSWLYNVYHIVSFMFYIFFFAYILRNTRFKNFLKLMGGFYLVSTILNLIISDVFFISVSLYTYLFGTFLILLSVGFYFFEILQSDEILNFNKSIYFYISIGTMIFHLVVCPLFIYDKYFDIGKSPEFVEIRRFILICANIFLYTCYIIGFMVCLRKNKSY